MYLSAVVWKNLWWQVPCSGPAVNGKCCSIRHCASIVLRRCILLHALFFADDAQPQVVLLTLQNVRLNDTTFCAAEFAGAFIEDKCNNYIQELRNSGHIQEANEFDCEGKLWFYRHSVGLWCISMYYIFVTLTTCAPFYLLQQRWPQVVGQGL